MRAHENFDDLIFEKRNKDYGAYDLRKSYSKFLLISLAIAIFLGSLVIIIPYLRVLSIEEATGLKAGRRYVAVTMEKLELPEEQIVLPPAAPPPPSGVQPSVKYVAPIVADTVLPTDVQTQSVADVQATPPDNNNNEELTVSSNAADAELTAGDAGEGGDEPFILVEVKPTFRGGDIEKFREWVQKRVVYPQEAQDNGIQGKVYLTFVVERDGSVSNVQIVRSVDPLLDKAAKTAIEASPKWSPGLQRGRPVRVRFSIFLNFAL